ncbi:MAG: M28 family peptidase [Aquaticitalea sp.]
MLKKAAALLLIILAVYWSFYALIPHSISGLDTPKNQFSSERALVHLKEISKQPHFVGAKNHETVRNYIVKQLEVLGLETQLQEGNTLTDWGTFVKPINILARIKGSDNTKALLLMSHYDSNPHSSPGASDAGSGVVTIIESLRAYLSENKTPKNDIIILITDAEELGLNGASLFVNSHPWAKEVGLVLNFEARGSGGPSYMLVETNGGNKHLIDGFKEANPSYPVANSLAYSIYKMLPNDTDLTRFREDANIDGFNFAFIDDHYDYHTALDNYDRLDRNSLEHQGSYMMPLLSYFSDANLNILKSDVDDVYFNVPILKTVSYPFSWILPMWMLAVLIFIALVFYGIKKRTLESSEMAKAFLPGIAAVVINGVVGYFGWKLICFLNPQYGEMLHGFTYNGHAYIWAFSLFSIAVCMWLYSKVYKPENTASLAVPPLFLWLVICGIVAFQLKGASFFIIPVYFGLISLFVLVRQKHPNILLMTLLLFPVLLIMSPFVKMFPVGLGLKMLIASTLLVSLIFSLCISVFGFSRYKNRWSYILFAGAIGFLIYAQLTSDFNEERPKPNSLVYIYDADKDASVWATYDHVLDDWTKKYLTDEPEDAEDFLNEKFSSKYKTPFTFSKKAYIKPLSLPYIDKQRDTVIGGLRHVKLFITPQRAVNRMEFFADTDATFLSFNLNGMKVEKPKNDISVFANRKNNRLFSYYVSENNYLEMEFIVPANQKTEFTLYSSSNDMLENPLFDVPKRPATMIPKPFILNDAVIVKKTISLE